MRKIYFLFVFAFVSLIAKAQIAYDFAATSGTFTELVGGTSPTFTACTGYTETDEGYANDLPIGFTFNYNGATYTQFHINSNGFLSLGAAFTDGDVYWRNAVGLNNGPNNGGGTNDKTSSRPLIAPLWDDMDMAATTNMTYATSGTAGNRVLTVQWKEVLWRYVATAPVVSFQVKLYESNGKIEFIYRSEAGAISSAPTASVGISAAAIGADNFISVNALTTAATVSKTTETTTIGTKPATGLTFSFTPGVLPAQDIQVQGWLNTPPVGCHNTPQSITVRLKNAGSAVINASAVSLNLTSTGANAGINLSSANSASIAVGATTDITFTGLNLNTVGATTLRAVATLATDPVPLNDTGRITVTTATVTSTFPISESYETSPFKFGWLRALAGTNAWALESNGYRNTDITANTADSLYPQDGSFFLLFNGWSAPAGTRSVIHSDCMTLPALTPGREHDISFWMSHDTSYMNDRDSIYVVVSTDRGQTWTRLQGFGRYNAAFPIPDWKDEKVLISAYAGQTIMLGFEGVGKFGNIIGLDNIVVKANLTLPVTLTSFTGKKEGNNNILSWTTANELNNKGFEVLRSADGTNFSSIGFEASKNNTTTSATSYNFVDEKALAGTNYYQLKQIDKDGKSTLSNVVVLKSATRKLEISTVYPNPANDKLNAVISSDKEEKITVSITDLAGKVVSSQQVSTTNGSTNVFFNLQGLSKGTYLLRLTSTKNNEIQIEKFVKQ